MLFVSSKGLTQKTLKVKRGYTYTYYTHPASHASKPTVLLLHGWPDEAREWFGLAKDFLIPAGYGVIIPDLLGYALTDKPRDASEYAMGRMADDIVDILDAEHVEKVISFGHDWGSGLAQRMYLYAPQRVAALAMVCVGYFPPLKRPINLQQVNDKFEQVFGYRCHEYQVFFASDKSDELTEQNLPFLFDMLQTDNFPQTVRQVMSVPNGVERLMNGKLHISPPIKWHANVSQRDKDHFVERFKRDGFNGAYNWYRAVVHKLPANGEHDVRVASPKVDVPALYVGYEDDWICRKELIMPAIQQGLLPHLTNVTLQGGHWGLVQDPKPFGETVLRWLEDIGNGKSGSAKL